MGFWLIFARFALSIFISNSTKISRSGYLTLALMYAALVPNLIRGVFPLARCEFKKVKYKMLSAIFVLPSPFLPTNIVIPLPRFRSSVE
ncbi:unannotated protein [freshwater metagenome]|uniref:Unannotated protein n=1 Tax=freshwater metagenome TaxID=449393 RepID=A0A6J7KFE5_9ZZZZ